MSATPEEVTGHVADDAAQEVTTVLPVARKPPNAGIGRVKGVPNLTTREAKQLAVMMANEQVDEAMGWLHRVGTDNPSRAFELYLDLLRLVIPPRMTSAAMAASFTAPDGTQSAFGLKVRGLFGLPEQPQSAPE